MFAPYRCKKSVDSDADRIMAVICAIGLLLSIAGGTYRHCCRRHNSPTENIRQ